MIQNILRLEPAIAINAVTSVVGLLVALGLISQANGDAVTTAAAAIIPAALTILASLLIRRNVFSQNTVSQMTDPVEEEEYV